jgi:hypothetical protein
MNFALDNAVMDNDLDAQGHYILNLAGFIPIPPDIVADDDPRLSDQRVPLDGSVTNAKVAATAGIVQSKLLLNGSIPSGWLGTTGGTAAAGNLAEYVSRKAQPNGYASLDGTGKIPVAQLPALAGVGTVTSVGLAMPVHFSVTGSPVTTAGALTAAWASTTGPCWFGVQLAGSSPPSFHTGPLPVGIIPNLPASQITSGIFDPLRLPVAAYGAVHNKGAVPDPGDATGDPTQYLARDQTYKSTPTSGKVTVITTTGAGVTFTPDSGCRVLFVELWGGGGGGGGAAASIGNCASGAGGGGGSYASKFITGTIASLYNVGVGVGGAGGGSGGGAGSPGGSTVWAGGPFQANGGNGGNGDNTGGTIPGVTRGGASGGIGASSDLAMSGGDGGDAIRWDGTHGRSGDGGDGASGGGGAKGRSGEGAGNTGNTYGGGGSGAVSGITTGTGYGGGAGAQGAIRITQYF